MRLRIHRAADEIGGNCIEVQARGASILLDLGMPLSGVNASAALLPTVEGLRDGRNRALLGIILSHPHLDHYGLLPYVHASVPVYLGANAKRMLRAATVFSPGAELPQSAAAYRGNEPFDLGPFRITPMLVDHSAFDAHALLVDADGKRLLYSGDFRLHGRKHRLMERLLNKPPRAIDALLMEGTTLGRGGGEEAESEAELEDRVARSLRDTPGLALTYSAGQNIDRLVTFYRAARRTGRGLILDMYTASILDALGSKTLPSRRAPQIRVYLPKVQKRRLLQNGLVKLAEPFRTQRIYDAEIRRHPERWVMLFRDSMRGDVETIGALTSGLLIYSLWPGYISRSPGPRVD